MKMSRSIDLIWQLSGAEAAAGEFKEIQPEHFCMGLLKLAELPVQQAAKLGADEATAKALATEIDLVRQELANRGIDSTRLRRALRGSLGKGGSPDHKGQMHRSQASRGLFDAAACAADVAGHQAVTAVHFLEVILNAPTPALAQVLPVKPAPQHVETPILDKYGEDLVVKVAKGELTSESDRTAECKAILPVLAGKKSVFLVSDDDAATQATLIGLAKRLDTENRSGAPSNRRRLIRAALYGFVDEDWQTVLNIFDDIFREAAQSQNVILVCHEEDLCTSTDPHLVKSAQASRLAQTPVLCVVPLSPKRYDALIKADRQWKRLAEAVWIRGEGKESVPREL
jgi:hypothetical protein